MNIIHYSIRSFLTNEYYSIIRFASKRLFVATLFIIPFYLVENGQLATSSVPQFHTDEVLLRQCHLLPIDLEGRTVLQQITAEVLDGVHRVGDQEHWCRRPGGVPDLDVPLVDSELALNALVPHVEDARLDLRPRVLDLGD